MSTTIDQEMTDQDLTQVKNQLQETRDILRRSRNKFKKQAQKLRSGISPLIHDHAHDHTHKANEKQIKKEQRSAKILATRKSRVTAHNAKKTALKKITQTKFDINEKFGVRYTFDGQSNIIDIYLPKVEEPHHKTLVAQELGDMAIHYVSRLATRVGEDKAVHLLITILDSLITLDALEEIDFIMGHMHPSRFSPEIVAALLIATKPIAEQLITRVDFVERMRDHIKTVSKMERFL